MKELLTLVVHTLEWRRPIPTKLVIWPHIRATCPQAEREWYPLTTLPRRRPHLRKMSNRAASELLTFKKVPPIRLVDSIGLCRNTLRQAASTSVLTPCSRSPRESVFPLPTPPAPSLYLAARGLTLNRAKNRAARPPIATCFTTGNNLSPPRRPPIQKSMSNAPPTAIPPGHKTSSTAFQNLDN